MPRCSDLKEAKIDAAANDFWPLGGIIRPKQADNKQQVHTQE